MSNKNPKPFKDPSLNLDNLHVADWSDPVFREAIDMGLLFIASYDTETTDLNKRFAEITEFGGGIFDIAGNKLHDVDAKGRVSPYTVISPYAWIIQRMKAEDLDKGDNRYLFAGKMMQFFRQASNLDEAPFKQDFLDKCRVVYNYETEDGEPADVSHYAYPVKDGNGEIDWDRVHIDPKLKRFHYKDDNGRWHKRDIRAMDAGYNNINADDHWLWTALHMAGADNIFVTHLTSLGKYRMDVLRAVESAVIAGAKGLNGIKPGLKKNPKTGEEYYSFSQGDILEANTHIASEVRGVLEGITLPDGSYPDLTQLHGAHVDALALFGIIRYMWKNEPEIMKQMIRNMDWKKVAEKLERKDAAFGTPIKTYIDKSFPRSEGKMVSLIGTDQIRNRPKVALVFNLSHDPRQFKRWGKTLKEFTASDWADLIKSAEGNPEGFVKVIQLHKSPRLFDAELGYKNGFNMGLTRTELAARHTFLDDNSLKEVAMAGLRLARPQLHGPERLVLPQLEEELFGAFNTLEVFDPEAGEDRQVHLFLNASEKKAMDSRNHALKIRSFWLSAMKPDEDILLCDTSEDEYALARKFADRLEDIDKKLDRENGPSLPPYHHICDRESAFLYKIELMFTMRQHLMNNDILDVGHNFWFEDKDGIRYSDDDVRSWSQKEIDEAYNSGNLNVRHEVTNTTIGIIDRMIEDLGYGQHLGQEVQAQLDAFKVLRREGKPNHSGNDSRWYTRQQAHRDLNKIRNNELMEDDLRALEEFAPGAADKFLNSHTDALSLLAEYEHDYLAKLPTEALSPSQKVRVNINPMDDYEIPQIEYEFAMNKAEILTVPDRYVEDPVLDPVTQRPLWILPLDENFNKKALNRGAPLVLKAENTGKTYHIAQAKLVERPERNGIYGDFYEAVQTRYADSAMKLPPNTKCVAVVGDGPYAVHHSRLPNEAAQSLKLEKQQFEGALAPQLASYRNKPQGVFLHDDGLSLKEGSVRLQEKEAKDGEMTGWEGETEITSVKLISLSDVEKMTDEEIKSFGFNTKEEAIDKLSTSFSKMNKDPRDKSNKLWAVKFDKIDAQDPYKGIFYYNPRAEINAAELVDFDHIAGLMEQGSTAKEAYLISRGLCKAPSKGKTAQPGPS